jgi:hypothetical protein
MFLLLAAIVFALIVTAIVRHRLSLRDTARTAEMRFRKSYKLAATDESARRKYNRTVGWLDIDGHFRRSDTGAFEDCGCLTHVATARGIRAGTHDRFGQPVRLLVVL